LETVDVFLRTFRRAGLNPVMSQGFHPQPKLRFASPLPVGLVSRDEYLEVELHDPPEPASLKKALDQSLPPGLAVKDVSVSPPGSPKLRASGARYLVESEEALFDRAILNESLKNESIWVTKKGKKGPRRIDLKTLLGPIRVLTPGSVDITVYMGQGGSVRPGQAVVALFELDPEKLDRMEVIKLNTLIEAS
jgi:radical SAM-linked protein